MTTALWRRRGNRARMLQRLILLVLTGCSTPGPTELDLYQLPPEDLSLDPAAIAVPTFLFGCDDWRRSGAPATPYVLIDVIFGALPGQPTDRPLERYTAAAEDNGGRVLATFHVPGFRAYAPTDRVPAIASSVPVGVVFLVSNPRRYDVKVGVTTSGNVLNDNLPMLVRFRALGGVVTKRFTGEFWGYLPNRSIPALRSDPAALRVQYYSWLCPVD